MACDDVYTARRETVTAGSQFVALEWIMRSSSVLRSPWPGGVLLVAGIVLGLFAAMRTPETVVVAYKRALTDRLPPFALDTDRDRWRGLLFEPLCPPPAGQRPLLRPPPASANCDPPDPVDGRVRVHLRPGLRLGGAPLSVEHAATLVQAWAERAGRRGFVVSWADIEIDAASGSLVFSPWSRPEAASLRAALADVTLADEIDDCRVGTGPWRERECAPERGDPADKVSWNRLPESLRDSDLVRDVGVLERADGWFDRRRLLLVGLDRPRGAASGGVTETDWSARLSAATAAALSAAPRQRLHLLRGIEGEHARALATNARPDEWEWGLQQRAGDAVTWIVANPALAPERRKALLSRIREAVVRPKVYDRYSGSPARALLPAVYAPVHFASGEPEGADPPACPSSGCGELLTHAFWRERAERLGGDNGIEPRVVSAREEKRRREAGYYALSLLGIAADDDSHPARFLARNLPVWFREHDADGLLAGARELAAMEAGGSGLNSEYERRLSALLRRLDDYVVPFTNPPAWVAVHRDLRGWDAHAQRLDPFETGLRSERLRATGGWWGFLLVVLGAAQLVAAWILRRDHRRRAAELRRTVEAVHHDLGAPLSSIRAEADHLRERLAPRLVDPLQREAVIEVATTLDHEASYAVDLVDHLHIVLVPGRELGIEAADGADLWHQALAPEIERLQARAATDAVTLDLRPPARTHGAVVALDVAGTRRIARNLIDNSYKYRRPGAVLGLRLDLRVLERWIDLEVEDDGTGFDDDLDDTRLFQPRQRSDRVIRAGIFGAGLGLASVRTLVESVGGRLELLSRRTPTRIRVRLPRLHRGASR